MTPRAPTPGGPDAVRSAQAMEYLALARQARADYARPEVVKPADLDHLASAIEEMVEMVHALLAEKLLLEREYAR